MTVEINMPPRQQPQGRADAYIERAIDNLEATPRDKFYMLFGATVTAMMIASVAVVALCMVVRLGREQSALQEVAHLRELLALTQQATRVTGERGPPGPMGMPGPPGQNGVCIEPDKKKKRAHPHFTDEQIRANEPITGHMPVDDAPPEGVDGIEGADSPAAVERVCYKYNGLEKCIVQRTANRQNKQ